MFTILIVGVLGMIAGGVIVYLFKDKITQDEAYILNLFKSEADKVKAAHVETVATKIVT